MKIEVLALVSLVGILSCQRRNPDFCPGFVHNECSSGSPDGGLDGSPDGSPDDGPDGGTVDGPSCTSSDECGGMTPACVNNVCQKCSAHAQCTVSNVCLPGGACAAPEEVAYVTGGATGTTCTKAAPCGTLDAAIERISRPYVKISGAVTEPGGVVLRRDVTILADPGASITGTTDATGTDTGDLLIIAPRPGAMPRINIHDLRLVGASGVGTQNPAVISLIDGAAVVNLVRVKATGASEFGVSMNSGELTITESEISDNEEGDGIFVASGKLTVVDSKISSNDGVGISVDLTEDRSALLTISHSVIEDNDGGGILIKSEVEPAGDLAFRLLRSRVINNKGVVARSTGGIRIQAGTFVIVSNIIAGNSSISDLSAGGVRIETLSSPVNRLEFNSLIGNSVMDGLGLASGIQCTIGSPNSFAARNNILFENLTSADTHQVGGNCRSTYSVLFPDGQNGSEGTIVRDPRFLSLDDFHLQPTSPARAKADPASTFDELSKLDIDGQLRPDPANERADIGADEAP